ncbi:AraC family transcriptional regulator [Actinomyces naeslundii]|uniref:GyrI-like small molecule binding domain protein n=2 Tax=Actinomyces naeslundii TaxID=1655 RepID=J3F2H0_ACTNH|nr:AraC family transcriptional regulator [Actinomyces naeslundii]EJN84502.1 GyrI-like small molecule binding domain protein [Actinomyces naeslundii str. Howell 279]OMG28494.1 AraC family transcriptional regulator [Actinomyces naeslundii]OMG34066.1 AraC family transcriptional regulator [Actinomyces naeslundii]OMG41320.1 AraC family transcriptional regulator [Actinomyces naeslundii]QQC19711.1 AraC family transcriptional regulator [Actinomyces naeslundii]
MRAEQYQRQLDAVTDYIYAHLDDDLSLETLAHVSGFSRYHWHRIYRAVRGETAAQTVRRLRLERAAAMLTETSWPVERIAWKAGFTGTEVFSRAFLRSYGTTPSRFRNDGRAASSGSSMMSCGSGLTSPVREAPGWPVRVEARCGYRLAVSEHRGSYMDIGRAFSRVRDRVGSGSLMVAIYEDDPDAVPPADLRSAAGTVVDPGTRIPHDLAERLVPAGRYAIMRYVGPYSSMHVAYLWLYGQWLPSSGEEPRDHPVIEEYLTDPATTPPVHAVTDILLPLL